MKRKFSFFITVILLHTYLTIALVVTLFNVKPYKWVVRRPGNIRLRKAQPSME
jgi:hypothetical protein